MKTEIVHTTKFDKTDVLSLRLNYSAIWGVCGGRVWGGWMGWRVCILDDV